MNALSLDMIDIFGDIKIEKIEKLKIILKLNEHARMSLKAQISFDTATYLLGNSLNGKELKLFCTQTRQSYFEGYIISNEVFFENGCYWVFTSCISASMLLDFEKKSRSFQDLNLTYCDIFKTVENEREDKINIVVASHGSDKIKAPIYQYEETDWEFCKRLASHFNLAVIPESTNIFPQISIGIVNGNRYEIDDNAEYEIGKMVGLYQEKQHYHACTLTDFVFYRLRDYRNFNLGDKIRFHGYNLIVVEKQFELVGSLVEIWYTLGQEAAFGLTKFENTKISGMTLMGTVIETKDELIRLRLDIDDGRRVSTPHWYRYAPITGNLMYSMPELDSRAMLYFQSAEDNENEIVCGCIRPNGETVLPEHKTKKMVTPKEKEMLLSPHEMYFQGKSKRSNNKLSLIDHAGLSLTSTKPIYISARGSVGAHSSCAVLAHATSQLRVEHPASNSEIEMSGCTLSLFAPRLSHGGKSLTYPPVNQNPAPRPKTNTSAADNVTASIPVVANPLLAAGIDLLILALTTVAKCNPTAASPNGHILIGSKAGKSTLRNEEDT